MQKPQAGGIRAVGPMLVLGKSGPAFTAAAERDMVRAQIYIFFFWLQEALDWAMRNQLWGHALFLSSKMDLRTYSWVLTGWVGAARARCSRTVIDHLPCHFQLRNIPVESPALSVPRTT